MTLRTVQLVLVLAAVTLTAAAQAPPPADARAIALQFKHDDPVWEDFSQEDMERNTCVRVLSMKNDGSPDLIVAAYAESDHSLKLIKAQDDGTYKVIDEPQGLVLYGAFCGIKFIDVDNDGINEIHVSFADLHGISTDWIFKVENGRFKNLTPTEPGRKDELYSLLTNAMFRDLHHDGTLSIVSLGDLPYPIDTPITKGDSIFSLKDGAYVLEASSVWFMQDFYRGREKPKVVDAQFEVPTTAAGPYELRVINGGRYKGVDLNSQESKELDGPVASGRIWLNGTEVVSPNLLSASQKTLTVTVTNVKKGVNELKVELAAKPGGKMTVILKGAGQSAE